MNIDAINKAFEEVVKRRGIYKKLRLKKSTVAQYRWRLKNARHISIDKKLQILQRSGYSFSELQYSDADLISVIRFTLQSGDSARAYGPEYLLEKWRRR